MSGFDIFLSYARQDRATARTFAECLGEEGFTVWWDASLRSGETFDEVIERNLREAKAVVVLWSPASVASRWVRAEATLADRRHKLAPAIIEACDRPIIFELTHAAELADWTGERSDIRWRTFVSDLQRLTDVSSEPVPVPADGLATAAAPAAPAATSDAEDESARAPMAARQSLRPGSDEVIHADRTRHQPPPARAPAWEPPAADPQAPSEVHCLEIEDGELDSQPIVIAASGVKIGRSAPADAVLPHASVSREHCIIGLANDELLVTDLNSTNGTYIDGARIHRATVLPVGSVLRLGKVSLKHSVHIRSDPEPSAGPGNPQPLPAGRLAATS